MRYLFIFTVLVSQFSGCLFAQPQLSTKSNRAIKLYQEALAKANLRDFDKAIILTKEAIDIDENFVEAYFLLGEVYTDNKQEKNAIDMFRKGIKLNPELFPPVYSNLANLEFNNGEYDIALEHISKYLTYNTITPQSKTAAQTLFESCKFAQTAIKNPVPFNPKSLGININSKNDEYWPSLTADEQTLVVTKLLPINPNNTEIYRNRQEDFYISSFENGKWTTAVPVGPPLNTQGNEGAQSISADGKIMIFTGCNRQDGVGRCDLYFSRIIDGKWSVPQNMGKPINTVAKETQPSISADGTALYFASDRPGGKGLLDIWKSTLNIDGTWGEPVNLGDSINTPFDEQSPFIHPDNQTLYFSSKGWPGLGAFDLYVSRKTNDTIWTTPKNLGYPINTNFSEEGLIVNARGNTAYYSTNRFAEGGRDIYTFELYNAIRPTTVSYMKGKTFDAETNKPLLARFELIDLASAKTIMDATSDETGEFLICIPSGKDYALNVSRKNYLFYSDNFTMMHGDYTKPFEKDVPLKPIKVGEKVVMRNIFYDIDSYALRLESQVELGRLIKLLKDNVLLKIEISGHTDKTGRPDYNRKLSENRAKTVAEYLVKNGIDTSRITSKGYGETQPIATNDTDDGRVQNRRTEFMVVAK